MDDMDGMDLVLAVSVCCFDDVVTVLNSPPTV